MTKNKIIVWLSLCIPLITISCNSLKKNKSHAHFLQTYEVLVNNRKHIAEELNEGRKKLVTLAKSGKNTSEILKKIKKNDHLNHRLLIGIEHYIHHTQLFLENKEEVNPIKYFLESNNDQNTVFGLKLALDKHSAFLQKDFLPYLSDTTSWSRKYLKFLPSMQRNTPPDFATFYFKNVSKEEALVMISTLQLGIFQEVLEIQQKIINEK